LGDEATLSVLEQRINFHPWHNLQTWPLYDPDGGSGKTHKTQVLGTRPQWLARVVKRYRRAAGSILHGISISHNLTSITDRPQAAGNLSTDTRFSEIFTHAISSYVSDGTDTLAQGMASNSRSKPKRLNADPSLSQRHAIIVKNQEIIQAQKQQQVASRSFFEYCHVLPNLSDPQLSIMGQSGSQQQRNRSSYPGCWSWITQICKLTTRAKANWPLETHTFRLQWID